MGVSASKSPENEKVVATPSTITIASIQPITSDSVMQAAILPVNGNRGAQSIAKEITKRFGI